jgi:ArsR family transcriptional regulator, arsenate/arsenite/antimonite-responsive transcriptional repressor
MKDSPPPLHDVLKALADPTRLRILALLAGGEICVCHVHTTLAVPQPTASRHLAYLKKTGLVEDRKVGLWKHYRLKAATDPAVQAVVDAAVNAVARTTMVTQDCCRLTEVVRRLPSPLQPESPTRRSREATR